MPSPHPRQASASLQFCILGLDGTAEGYPMTGSLAAPLPPRQADPQGRILPSSPGRRGSD